MILTLWPLLLWINCEQVEVKNRPWFYAFILWSFIIDIRLTFVIKFSRKTNAGDFDVSMTSCHHYQENEENLHKQVDKTKLKTIVYCSKPVNHQVTSHKGKPKSSE